jgi:ferritin-like metal-binding protein YciE
MTVKTLNDLFIHDLSDVYSAEKQITRALPKMARAASDENLIAAFNQHLEETRAQIERLDELVEVTPEVKIKRMKCHALEGLVGAAQKVEHYEIATYGTLHALALKLGYTKAAQLLEETLNEEKQTDEKLTSVAESITVS